MNGNQVYHKGLSDNDRSIRVYQLFTAIFHKCMNIAINLFYIFPINAGIMLNAFNDPLCSKLCMHNRGIFWPQ